jgi:hypothetical protein
MRWRVQQEVIDGKGACFVCRALRQLYLLLPGQFICGNTTCDTTEGLKSYEVR